MEIDKKAYDSYVKEVTPTHSLPVSMAKAFLVGGVICTLGQALTNWFMQGMGMEKEAASSWMLLTLIALSIILTGLGLYPKLVRFGGAGALVPITGFANSVVAPAVEYKTEGHVYGIGCKIFTIAGPVILFGVLSSWVLGMIYWLGKMWGML